MEGKFLRRSCRLLGPGVIGLVAVRDERVDLIGAIRDKRPVVYDGRLDWRG